MIEGNNSKLYNINLVIPQSNNYDITFNWNGEEYELLLDASFWIQPYPVESFINKLSQHYANDVIITESQKLDSNQSNQNNTLMGQIQSLYSVGI